MHSDSLKSQSQIIDVEKNDVNLELESYLSMDQLLSMDPIKLEFSVFKIRDTENTRNDKWRGEEKSEESDEQSIYYDTDDESSQDDTDVTPIVPDLVIPDPVLDIIITGKENVVFYTESGKLYLFNTTVFLLSDTVHFVQLDTGWANICKTHSLPHLIMLLISKVVTRC